MNVRPEQMVQIIGEQQVQIVLLHQEVTRRDEAIKELQRRLSMHEARNGLTPDRNGNPVGSETEGVN